MDIEQLWEKARKKKAKIEDRELIRSYGGNFNLKYLLLHYFLDLPFIQFKKILGIKTILDIRESTNELAFRGNYSNIFTSILSQISPLPVLIFAKIV